jgi:hypothetical protein
MQKRTKAGPERIEMKANEMRRRQTEYQVVPHEEERTFDSQAAQWRT